MSKYNGWTNYETWKVNLELVDSESLAEMLKDYEPEFSNFVEMVRDSVSEIAYLDTEQNTFAASAVYNFLNAVNWYEIAEHIQEGYSE